MLILSEVLLHADPRTMSERDLWQVAYAGAVSGCPLFTLPPDFGRCGTAENALAHVPTHAPPTPAVWIGYIPSPERYCEVHATLLSKQIHLLNTPEQHLRAMEFDRSYPRLAGLTPESVILEDADGWEEAGHRLGFPLFVRGTARSRKAEGWKACVAETPAELEMLVRALFELPYRSRGRVIVRKLVPLRHSRLSQGGFPLAREFRVFLYQQQVLAYGYYWEGDDPLSRLTTQEEALMLELAREAAGRLQVPFLAVDVAQAETGEWRVIEVGDAQFAGVSQTPLLPLWAALRRATEVGNPPI